MTTAPAVTRDVWAFDAIGTRWSIETPAPLSPAVQHNVSELIARFDAEWSRFRADSVVSRLGAQGGSAPAPADTADMLEAYINLADATAGAVNPLIGASLERLGYDAAYSLVDRGAAPAPGDWQARLTMNDGMLTLDGPATIDVGALGKGRLVDLVVAEVEAEVAGDVVVDASGDLAVRGTAQRIGLEHPFDPKRAIGVVEITDRALCASAINRRAWGSGLHHVLDARTGQPVRTIAATWAIAPTAMRADAVATALFFDGGPELAASWDVEWVRMTTDGVVEWSPRTTAELFV